MEEAEAQRRQRQREAQAAARAARAAGEEYQGGAKKKRKPLERRKFEQRSGDKKRQRRAGQKAAKRHKAEVAHGAPEVVVVPIFWKGVASQRGKVLGTCKDLEQLLERGGVRVELDTRTKYTPGQKFAYWEHRGVRLRIELGPREAERGCCTVCRSFTPGTPAARREGIPMSETALLPLLEVLKHAKDESEVAQAKTEGVEVERKLEVEADVDAGGTASGRAAQSGDALEDDFVEAAAAEVAREEADGPPERKAGERTAAKATKRKRPKVVNF